MMKNRGRNCSATVVILLVGVLLVACDNSTTTADSRTAQMAPNTAKIETTSSDAAPEIVMYKSPSCECCTGWAEHLRRAGFNVIENKRDDMNIIKVQYGVPEKMASCHTAIVDGYIIEGHVPAEDVTRLLRERPDVAGLSAPGMPMKSPGMQSVGQKPQGYDVLAFDKDGSASVFHSY
ncbi:DUF411 domain-containing protein [Mariprofundus ferrooxydans]|uniref:DUF411 domain-containing protein n=1 Tax=Mariprofundus ferrooxydans TaxID=314344 RepID=UPI001431531A|nr:DUF411 domain-containing protein [Mariprofundus ferrooxydans]